MEYLSLGCYNDNPHAHAIQSLESENTTFLDGSYHTRKNSILKCALEAAKNSFNVFAVQNGGACHSDVDAQNNYSAYGNTSCPGGGKGGHLVNEVYLLGGKCRFLMQHTLNTDCNDERALSFLLNSSQLQLVGLRGAYFLS